MGLTRRDALEVAPRGHPRDLVVRQVDNLRGTHPTLGYTPWTSVHLRLGVVAAVRQVRQ